jgi:hypothetical protein
MAERLGAQTPATAWARSNRLCRILNHSESEGQAVMRAVAEGVLVRVIEGHESGAYLIRMGAGMGCVFFFAKLFRHPGEIPLRIEEVCYL